MYPESERESIYNRIVNNAQWCFWRYTEENRTNYMKCRTAIESMLYNDFTSNYWELKFKNPVYFYTIHYNSIKLIEGEIQKRTAAGECRTQYLIFDLGALPDYVNVTFTVNDSFRSYKSRLKRDGLPCDFIIDEMTNIPDYGKIFPISELRGIQSKYEHIESLKCEIQIWDPTLCTAYLENNPGNNSDVFSINP